MHGLHINEICLSSWCSWHGLHINEICLSFWCSWHGLHINEISLSSWCKLFAQSRANNHTLCHRSLPLFLTFLTQQLKELQCVGADVGVFTLCLLSHEVTVTTSRACGDAEHAWWHQKSEPTVVPVSCFHNHNTIYIYDTMPRVAVRTERLSIWTSPKLPVAQIYSLLKSHKSNITNLGICLYP